jgi:hypothetical protein
MRGLVIYPCPLGDGDFAELRLPSLLTTRDTRRIIAFVQTLALKPEPSALPVREPEPPVR